MGKELFIDKEFISQNPKKPLTLRGKYGVRKASVKSVAKPKANSTGRTSSVSERTYEFVPTSGTDSASVRLTTEDSTITPSPSRNGLKQPGRMNMSKSLLNSVAPIQGRKSTGTKESRFFETSSNVSKVGSLPSKTLGSLNKPRFAVRDIIIIVLFILLIRYLATHLSINVNWS